MCFRTYLEAGGRYSQHKQLPRNHKSYKGHLIELLDNNKIYEAGQTVIRQEFCMNRIAQLSVSMM
jgi:hypothetical protein